MSKATEDALFDSSYLACATTFGAYLWICSRAATNSVAQRATLNALDFNFLPAAEYCLFKQNREVNLQAVSPLWSTLCSQGVLNRSAIEEVLDGR